MTSLFGREELPDSLRAIPELDLSGELLQDPLAEPWFLLGAWTTGSNREDGPTESVVERQCLLIDPGSFGGLFEDLESIGNVFHSLGIPACCEVSQDGEFKYRYEPFHRFHFDSEDRTGEPLVFANRGESGTCLYINPDILLFFRLEERGVGSGVWWDARRAAEVLRRRVVNGDREVVEIRTDYLLRYLRARQMALLIGHYRHLHLYNAGTEVIAAFEVGDITLGSPEKRVKALLQNLGLRDDIALGDPFLQRRLHLWFELSPPALDSGDPWDEKPPFDPHEVTFPTHAGPVAPARWRHFPGKDGSKFQGVVCDFMTPVYFRQDVLSKYETTTGFEVGDNGSVSCGSYWGLVRSTRRIGNELVSTAIGDFAEGVPFHEWPHWRSYVAEVPSLETIHVLREEKSIPSAVNDLVAALAGLNESFDEFATALRAAIKEPLWTGSLESLAARQLKWVYPVGASDDEFLKRATLLSTLLIDALMPEGLRLVLRALHPDLHQNREKPPSPLGPRKLLERATLVAVLVAEAQPQLESVARLVHAAESRSAEGLEEDLTEELTRIHARVRSVSGPLAFLYDLRVGGGLAHPPSSAKVGEAAAGLGLPRDHWTRAHFLRLLAVMTESIQGVAGHLQAAALAMEDK